MLLRPFESVMITTVCYLLPNCDAIGKVSATEQQKCMVKNQFSAEESMSRNQKTRNQLCTEMSEDTWKSTSA